MTFLFILYPFLVYFILYPFLVYLGSYAIKTTNRGLGNAFKIGAYLIFPFVFQFVFFSALTILPLREVFSASEVIQILLTAIQIAIFILAPIIAYLKSKKLYNITHTQAAMLALFWGIPYLLQFIFQLL